MARFNYARLARYPGIWRVDGVGPMRAGGKLGGRSVIYLSGLTEDGIENPYWKQSLNSKTLMFPVHSASLRDFKVGSIWKNGEKIADAPRLDRTKYHVDVSRAQIVTLNQTVQLNGFWASSVVPDERFHFGDNRIHLSQTLYAVLPVLNDRLTHWLVLPVSELFRFYTGVSSRMLAGALQGRLENYVNWEKCRIEQGRPVLHVKRPINRKEAAVLGRAVVSASAKASLLGVHQHLSSTSANNNVQNESNKRPLVIRTSFPFADQTHLYVSGKRMPLAQKGGQWSVFAMEILHCSHQWGFPGVILELDDLFEANTQGAGGTGSPPPRFNPRLDDDTDDYGIDDLPADQRLGRLVVRSFTNQFGAMDELSFEYRQSKSGSGWGKSEKNIDVSVIALTLGDGDYSVESTGNLGVSEFQSRVEVARELSKFLEVLDHLRSATKARSWRVVTRNLGGQLTQGNELIALFPEKVGRLRTWHLIVESNNNIRPRQLVWAEVALRKEDHFVYIFEMELKENEESGQCTILVHLNDFSRLDDETFKVLIRLTAIQKRWPHRKSKWKDSCDDDAAKEIFSMLIIYRIYHPSVRRSKKTTESVSSKPTELNSKSWSMVLLERIEEITLTANLS